MPALSNVGTAEKILTRLKGLRTHLQPDEVPLLTIPAIWDGGQEQHSKPCDVVLTNQRLLGYVYVTFPRERLFLETLPLSTLTAVSLRRKTFEPVFRELLVSSGQRKVYIRAPRQKIESLYAGLRSAIEQYTPAAQAALEEDETQTQVTPTPTTPTTLTTPVYGRQEIHTPFDRSPLAILLLFVGGLLLEVLGVISWVITQSIQIGLPLIFAGLMAVITATVIKRQQR